jgi:hypothetical protein
MAVEVTRRMMSVCRVARATERCGACAAVSRLAVGHHTELGMLCTSTEGMQPDWHIQAAAGATRRGSCPAAGGMACWVSISHY